MKEFFVKVTGVTFENRQRTIAGLRCGDQLKFVADPTNLYDHNAVEVETVNGDQVGFIPKDHNAQIFHNLMLGNGTYSVSVEEITGGGFNANYGVNMKVTFVVNKPSENDPSSLINAPVRNYDNGRESVVEEIRDDYVFVKDDHGESIYKFLGYYKFLNHADRTLFLSLYGSKIDIYKSQLEKKSTVIHYNAFDENDDELEQYYDLEEDSSMDDNFYTGDFNFDNFE